MKFSQLETFRAVVQSGSFTAAAKKLFMTQPAVTAQIQALEREWGCQLFVRSNRETLLTPKGMELNQRIDQIFAMLEDLSSAAHAGESDVSGNLPIAASSVMGNHVLVPMLGQFAASHPRVGISLIFGNAKAIADKVREGLVDYGFAPRCAGYPDLNFVKMHTEPCVLVANSGSRLAGARSRPLEGLCDGPIVLREQGTKIREIAIDWLKKHAGLSSGSGQMIELGTMEAINNFLVRNEGISILPRCCVQGLLEAGRLKVIDAPAIPDVDYYWISRRDSPVGEVARLFHATFQAMRGEVAENPSE